MTYLKCLNNKLLNSLKRQDLHINYLNIDLQILKIITGNKHTRVRL